jgi:hypothetical protein
MALMKAKTVSVSLPEDIVEQIEKSAESMREKFSEWMRRAALSRLEGIDQDRPRPATTAIPNNVFPAPGSGQGVDLASSQRPTQRPIREQSISKKKLISSTRRAS